MGAYYRLNYLNAPNNQWPQLKVKFYAFLVCHHQEWKAIREKAPLDYLPYMEAQFEVVTGLKVMGLGAYTGWIRAGTYYHWVVAQQGQLRWCPELAGVDPPRGLMHLPLYPPVTPQCNQREPPKAAPWTDPPRLPPCPGKGVRLPQTLGARRWTLGVQETPPP